MFFIQHCFICRPSDSNVSEDARSESRTVATLAVADRHSNHSVISNPLTRLDLIQWIKKPTNKTLFFSNVLLDAGVRLRNLLRCSLLCTIITGKHLTTTLSFFFKEILTHERNITYFAFSRVWDRPLLTPVVWPWLPIGNYLIIQQNHHKVSFNIDQRRRPRRRSSIDSKGNEEWMEAKEVKLKTSFTLSSRCSHSYVYFMTSFSLVSSFCLLHGLWDHWPKQRRLYKASPF